MAAFFFDSMRKLIVKRFIIGAVAAMAAAAAPVASAADGLGKV